MFISMYVCIYTYKHTDARTHIKRLLQFPYRTLKLMFDRSYEVINNV